MIGRTEAYKHLNEQVFYTFFSENEKGTSVILNIDDAFMELSAERVGLTKDRFLQAICNFLSDSWSQTLQSSILLPQYLGVIAVQVYAAHLMDDEQSGEFGFGEKAYNPRLANLLQIDINALQHLYKESQEIIWENFQRWTKSNGFELNIPVSKIGTGRYSQFPLSQAMLNRKDLRSITRAFNHIGIRAGETFYFPDFLEIYRHADKSPYVSKHYLKLKERLFSEGKEEILYRQVFHYYNRWDGQIEEESVEGHIKLRSRLSEEGGFSIIISDNLDKIEILDFQNKSIESYSLDEKSVVTRLNRKYRVGRDGLMFFIVNEDFDNEWIYDRFLQCNTSILIIGEKTSNLQRFFEILSNYGETVSSSNYYILKCNLPEHLGEIETLIPGVFGKVAARLKGGLRLSRNTWMEKAGPELHLLDWGQFWINGQRVSGTQVISCADFEAGRYAIKHRDFSPKIFHIERPIIEGNSGCSKGWRVCKDPLNWSFETDDSNIQGMHFIVQEFQEEKFDYLRDWIIGNTGNKKIRKGDCQMINALNRSKHGLR